MSSDTSDRFRRALSEGIAGAGGIILSAYFVYPVDFVKTRLQLPQSPYTSMTDGFVRIVREEGFLTLYQGVEGELLKGSLQNFIYLFSYDLLKGYAREEKMLVEEGGRRGGGAGKVTHERPLLNKTLHCYCHGSNTSGIRYAYRKERASETRERRASLADGKVLSADDEEEVSLDGGKEQRQIVKVITSTAPLQGNSAAAGADTAPASPSDGKAQQQPQLSILSNLLIGIVAGCFCQLFINPLSVIQTRIMTAAKRAATSAGTPAAATALKASQSIVGTAVRIWREEGFLAFYTGLLPAFILTTNPAIQFLVFDRLKSMLTVILRQHEHTRPINAIESFVIGAIAKITATLATYPYIMAKLRLQYKGPLPPGQRAPTGTVDVIASIVRREGLAGLYAGLRAQLLKSVLGAALMFMMKEKIVEWSQRMLKTKAERERDKEATAAAAAAAGTDGKGRRDKKEV